MKHKWIAGAAVAALGLGGAAGSVAPAFGASAGAAVTSYKLSASGTGLELSIGGHTLIASTSTVSAVSGGPVDATGTGELLPVMVATEKATVSAPGTSENKAELCTAHPSSSFPAPFSTMVNLNAACASAMASEGPAGQPSATATGDVASLVISPPSGGSSAASSLSALLPTRVTPGSQLATALTGIFGQLPKLPQSGLPLGTVVQQVAKNASGSTVTTLVNANLGPTTSEISSSGTYTVRSASTGATVSLLEGAGAGGGPLLTVTVGKAVDTSQIDPTSGAVTESATSSLVTVTINPPSGTRQTVSIAPGTSKSFFTGTPLQTTIKLATASTTAKSGTASGSGVSIDLAQGTGSSSSSPTAGGVVVTLGGSTTKASSTAPSSPGGLPQTAAGTASSGSGGSGPSITGATTVHTGEPWSGSLPIALFSMSMLAGLGLLARRHLLGVGHLAGRFAGRLVRPRGR